MTLTLAVFRAYGGAITSDRKSLSLLAGYARSSVQTYMAHPIEIRNLMPLVCSLVKHAFAGG